MQSSSPVDEVFNMWMILIDFDTNTSNDQRIDLDSDPFPVLYRHWNEMEQV